MIEGDNAILYMYMYAIDRTSLQMKRYPPSVGIKPPTARSQVSAL